VEYILEKEAMGLCWDLNEEPPVDSSREDVSVEDVFAEILDLRRLVVSLRDLILSLLEGGSLNSTDGDEPCSRLQDSKHTLDQF